VRQRQGIAEAPLQGILEIIRTYARRLLNSVHAVLLEIVYAAPSPQARSTSRSYG
jgi:hypothetical protein